MVFCQRKLLQQLIKNIYQPPSNFSKKSYITRSSQNLEYEVNYLSKF